MAVSLLLAFVLSNLSCWEQSLACDLPEISLESKNIKLGMQNKVEVTMGFLALLDTFVEKIRNRFGLSLKNENLKYFVYIMDKNRTDEICKATDDYNPVGCFVQRDDTAFTVLEENSIDAVYHELIHAIIHLDAKMNPPLFIDEGLAEAFGDGGCAVTEEKEKLSLDIVYKNVNNQLNRRILQSFFKHIYEKHGASKLMHWGYLLKSNSNLPFIKRAFETVYEEKLDDVWRERWGPFKISNFNRCLSEPHLWKTEKIWNYHFNVYSSLNFFYLSPRSRIEEAVIEIFEENVYLVNVIGVSANISLASCDTCLTTVDLNSSDLITLSPGKYSVRMLVNDENIDKAISVHLKPYIQCDPYGNDCPSGEKCHDLGDEIGIQCASWLREPLKIGDNCEEPQQGRPDPCEEGASCAAGECKILCQGTINAPQCPGGFDCYSRNSNNLYPGVCFERCNPSVSKDCQPHQYCKLASRDPIGHVCVTPKGGSLYEGDPCDQFDIEQANPFAVSDEPKCIGNTICVKGTCKKMCDPNTDEQQCSAELACHPMMHEDAESEDSIFGLCLKECNPTALDCSENELCVQDKPDSTRFFCQTKHDSLIFTRYGDGFCTLFSCGKGLYCTYDRAVPNSKAITETGICTALCNTSDENPDINCQDVDQGQYCKPINKENDLGYCTID